MIYKRNCEYCKKYYEGIGRQFCSRKCANHRDRSKRSQYIDKACLFCGLTFSIRPSLSNRKFCCKKCANSGPRKRRVKYIEKECLHCKKGFEVRPSEKNRKFCSKECWHNCGYSDEAKKTMSRVATKRCSDPEYKKLFLKRVSHSSRLKKYHKNRKATRVEIKCNVCGKIFKVKRSRADRKGNQKPRFCSKKCFFLGRLLPWKGKTRPEISREKNWNWNNGSSFFPYSIEFNNSLKEKIRDRDHRICQLCGRTQEEEMVELKKKLPIHHIDYNKCNNKKHNLITLCLRCNTIVNKDRIDWMNYFKKYVNKRKF